MSEPYCQQCGKLIPAPRLEASPTTVTCSKACAAAWKLRAQRISNREAQRRRAQAKEASDE